MYLARFGLLLFSASSVKEGDVHRCVLGKNRTTSDDHPGVKNRGGES